MNLIEDMNDIQIDKKTAVTLYVEITVLCDERQRNLLKINPEAVLVIPKNAYVKKVEIIDEEQMPSMTPTLFIATMKQRNVNT